MDSVNRPAHMAPPVPLFLAVASGPRYIQKFTLGAWDPMVSIRQLGASIMGPNVEMLRAEASATIDGVEASIWTGTFLDLYTVGGEHCEANVHQVRLRSG